MKFTSLCLLALLPLSEAFAPSQTRSAVVRFLMSRYEVELV